MPERAQRRRYGSSEMHASRAYVVRNRTPCGYPHSFNAERFPYLYSSFQRDHIFPRCVGYGDPAYPPGRNEFDLQRATEERAAMRSRRHAREEEERRRLMHELAELTSYTVAAATAAPRRAQRVSLASQAHPPSATALPHVSHRADERTREEGEIEEEDNNKNESASQASRRQSGCSTPSKANVLLHGNAGSRRCSDALSRRASSHTCNSKEHHHYSYRYNTRAAAAARPATMDGMESLADTVRQQDEVICRCLSAPTERAARGTPQGLTSAATTLSCSSGQQTLASSVMHDMVVFDSPTSRFRSKATLAALRQAWQEANAPPPTHA